MMRSNLFLTKIIFNFTFKQSKQTVFVLVTHRGKELHIESSDIDSQFIYAHLDYFSSHSQLFDIFFY